MRVGDPYFNYMYHSQELEDIIEMIVQAIQNGEDDISMNLYDDFSVEDILYIEEEVRLRL